VARDDRLPLVGASSPHSIRMVVDLPCPVGPEVAEDLPALDVEETPRTAVKSPNRLTEAARLEDRVSTGLLVAAAAARSRALRWPRSRGPRTSAAVRDVGAEPGQAARDSLASLPRSTTSARIRSPRA
jgi:hypothetical protein